MQTKGKILNVLGDSITEGANATEFSRAYHQILKNLGGFSQVNAYGIGGTRIAKQTVLLDGERPENCFLVRAENMQKNADIVLVFGGTNDYGHGDAPLGAIGDETDSTFCGACKILFSKLRALYPTACIIVILPLRRFNEDNPYGENGNKEIPSGTLGEYSSSLKEIAEEFSFPICDLREDVLLNPNDKELNEKYFGDGLHPNDAGHQILAERLFEFIENL